MSFATEKRCRETQAIFKCRRASAALSIICKFDPAKSRLDVPLSGIPLTKRDSEKRNSFQHYFYLHVVLTQRGSSDRSCTFVDRSSPREAELRRSSTKMMFLLVHDILNDGIDLRMVESLHDSFLATIAIRFDVRFQHWLTASPLQPQLPLMPGPYCLKHQVLQGG